MHLLFSGHCVAHVVGAWHVAAHLEWEREGDIGTVRVPVGSAHVGSAGIAWRATATLARRLLAARPAVTLSGALLSRGWSEFMFNTKREMGHKEHLHRHQYRR